AKSPREFKTKTMSTWLVTRPVRVHHVVCLVDLPCTDCQADVRLLHSPSPGKKVPDVLLKKRQTRYPVIAVEIGSDQIRPRHKLVSIPSICCVHTALL
ncbi:hypothetical protein T310_10092, partial [Rasamsonia emersonii CBS 393.64]